MNAPPFELLGLDHLLLHVQGMAEAERFYCGVLGCEVKHRLPKDAMIELSAGIVLVDTADPNGAWALDGTRPGRNLDHFALIVGPCDVDAARKWLADNGVEIERERDEDGEVSLYVSDPSGNRIELVRRS